MPSHRTTQNNTKHPWRPTAPHPGAAGVPPTSWAHPRAPGPPRAGPGPTRHRNCNIAIGSAQGRCSRGARGQYIGQRCSRALHQAAAFARRRSANPFIYSGFFLRLALCSELYPGVLYSSYGTTSHPSPSPCPMRVSFSSASPSLSCKQTVLLLAKAMGTHHVPLFFDVLLELLSQKSIGLFCVHENVPVPPSLWASLAPNGPIGTDDQAPRAIVEVFDAVVTYRTKQIKAKQATQVKNSQVFFVLMSRTLMIVAILSTSSSHLYFLSSPSTPKSLSGVACAFLGAAAQLAPGLVPLRSRSGERALGT